MVHRSRARSSSLFLMELILAILFFSVASAVCVEFFVKSHLLSQDSEAMTYAVNECVGAAEIFCAADSVQEGLALLREQYPEGEYTDELRAFVYYDSAGHSCEREVAAYVMEVRLEQEEQMVEIVAEMFRLDGENGGNGGNGQDEDGQDGGQGSGEESVYRLETAHHIARRTAFDEG